MASHLLYLVRHGLAAEQGPEFANDDDRPLTSGGIERLRAQVLGLRELDVRIDRVLTSPLVRAAQTAEILAAGVGCDAPLVTVDALRPGGRYDAVLAALARLGSDRSIGFESFVGREVNTLVAEANDLPSYEIWRAREYPWLRRMSESSPSSGREYQ